MKNQIRRKFTTPLGDTVETVLTIEGDRYHEDITVTGPPELIDGRHRSTSAGKNWPTGGRRA